MNTSIKISEIKIGIKCCLENAADLIQEAELLFKNRRFARTYSLTQLALEEIGKSMMLYDLYNSLQMDQRKEFDFKDFRKNFRDHKWKTFKTNLIDFMMYAENGKSDFEEFTEVTFAEIQKIKNGHYDKMKNDSLYVSITNDKFHKPNEIFDEKYVGEFFTNSKTKIEFATQRTNRDLNLDERIGADKEAIITQIKKDLNK